MINTDCKRRTWLMSTSKIFKMLVVQRFICFASTGSVLQLYTFRIKETFYFFARIVYDSSHLKHKVSCFLGFHLIWKQNGRLASMSVAVNFLIPAVYFYYLFWNTVYMQLFFILVSCHLLLIYRKTTDQLLAEADNWSSRQRRITIFFDSRVQWWFYHYHSISDNSGNRSAIFHTRARLQLRTRRIFAVNTFRLYYAWVHHHLLFAGHVVGSRPMKRKRKTHLTIITIID